MSGLLGGLSVEKVKKVHSLSLGLVGADGSKQSVQLTLPGTELEGVNELSTLENAIGAVSNNGIFRATLTTEYKMSIPLVQVNTGLYDTGRVLQIVLQDNRSKSISVAIPAPKLSLFPNRRILVTRDATAEVGTPARIVDDLFSALENAINKSSDPIGTYAVVRTALTSRKSGRFVTSSVPLVNPKTDSDT